MNNKVLLIYLIWVLGILFRGDVLVYQKPQVRFPGHPKNGVVKTHRFIMSSLPLQRWTQEGQDLRALA